jgi:hypothetical protein
MAVLSRKELIFLPRGIDTLYYYIVLVVLNLSPLMSLNVKM